MTLKRNKNKLLQFIFLLLKWPLFDSAAYTFYYRYVGRMAFAQTGFVEPGWFDIHFIKFTSDLFAVLWLDEGVTFLYTRQRNIVF